MKARITFRSEIVIEGKDISEIRDKWFKLNIYSNEANALGMRFIETNSVEDAETFEDIKSKLVEDVVY